MGGLSARPVESLLISQEVNAGKKLRFYDFALTSIVYKMA